MEVAIHYLVPYLLGQNQFKWEWIYHQKLWRLEQNGTTFFQALKKIKKNYKARMLYTVKICFRNAGEIKTYTGEEKQNLTPAYYFNKWLKQVL